MQANKSDIDNDAWHEKNSFLVILKLIIEKSENPSEKQWQGGGGEGSFFIVMIILM